MSIQEEQDKQDLVTCNKNLIIKNDAYDAAKLQLIQVIRDLESISLYQSVSSDEEKTKINEIKIKVGN